MQFHQVPQHSSQLTQGADQSELWYSPLDSKPLLNLNHFDGRYTKTIASFIESHPS